MMEADLRQLNRALRDYREVFDRHFATWDEALTVEVEALAGNDLAQVKLWMLYQDAKYDKGSALKSQGSYSLTRITYERANVVHPGVATRFKQLAREASNVDAVDFVASVTLGNRDPLAHYAIFNHGRDDFYTFDHPLKRLKFQDSAHFRYLGDLWWDSLSVGGRVWNALGSVDFTHDPYLYVTDVSKHTTPQEYAAFIRHTYSRVIPALEECARAGHASAAAELHRIHSSTSWEYTLDRLFSSTRRCDNPWFDPTKAQRWSRIRRMLAGEGEEELLATFILAQEDTPEGLFNIGVALSRNPHVRALYDGYAARGAASHDAPETFLLRAADLGQPVAAWFMADRLHTSGEKDDDRHRMQAALSWYRRAAELGHPNAKHRYTYLSRKHGLLPAPGGQRLDAATSRGVGEPGRPDSKTHALRVFLCYSSEDRPRVEALYRRLRDAGMEPWFDQASLPGGAEWEYHISRALHESDVVLVCLSRSAVSKVGYIQLEIRAVLRAADMHPPGSDFIVPVKLEECEVPSWLGAWQWVNLYDVGGTERLVSDLKARATRSA